MRIILVLLIVSLAATAVHAEDDVSLPVAAQKILVAMTDDITIAKQKAVKDLRKLASDLGKADDLDAALVVKKAADELSEEIKASQPDLIGAKPAGVAVYNGRWLANGTDIFEFKNGKYACLMGNGVGQPRWASGELTLINPTTLAFSHGGFQVVTFRIVNSDLILESNGNKQWTRIKDK
jgi:hypothetical protein